MITTNNTRTTEIKMTLTGVQQLGQLSPELCCRDVLQSLQKIQMLSQRIESN